MPTHNISRAAGESFSDTKYNTAKKQSRAEQRKIILAERRQKNKDEGEEEKRKLYQHFEDEWQRNKELREGKLAGADFEERVTLAPTLQNVASLGRHRPLLAVP